MFLNIIIATAMATTAAQDTTAQAPQTIISRNDANDTTDLMTPETLWAMGRISNVAPSPNGQQIAYQTAYYSVEQNKGHHVIIVSNADGTHRRQLTTTDDNETDPTWLDDHTIAFLSGGQLWQMSDQGTHRHQLTTSEDDIEGFKFSPDHQHVILIKSLPYHGTIKQNPTDLPLATGRLVTDLNYRHWDHYVETIPHPFLAKVIAESDLAQAEESKSKAKIFNVQTSKAIDIMQGEPYECPTAPFGGIEQLDWSPDSRYIAYTSRKKEGTAYAISTDTDIYLYDVALATTVNLCKPQGYTAPEVDATHTLADQAVNADPTAFTGYDQNPQFSPDGQWLAWQSMQRDGYESDLNRIYILDFKKYIAEKNDNSDNSENSEKSKSSKVAKGFFLDESLDTNKDAYCWATDSKSIYYTACWHATTHIYKATLPKYKKAKAIPIIDGERIQLTEGQYDYGTPQTLGRTGLLIATRHSMSAPDDIYTIDPRKKGVNGVSAVNRVSTENDHILTHLTLGGVTDTWIPTTDGQQMQVWIITPPHFDPTKKYPTLLYCEGGPQSPVSQFWSYRWNFQIMAAHGYVIIAPNRHGLPGYGQAWCEEISGDWTGQCMSDYLAAIDYATANLPYVDPHRLGAVGASFGGFSVYYLAGHHQGRFKCFIAHDGAFNLESMYTDTEEAWFSNWEYDDAYWNPNATERARRTYANSPHRFIDQWDTPILCIHGEKDYRINANQGMGAFNAARLKGIPAELLIFPDENHWVLHPQNGILWQRTFFNWLDRWLKH